MHENDNTGYPGNNGSFQEHAECMKRFRLAHLNLDIEAGPAPAGQLMLIPLPPVDLDWYAQN